MHPNDRKNNHKSNSPAVLRLKRLQMGDVYMNSQTVLFPKIMCNKIRKHKFHEWVFYTGRMSRSKQCKIYFSNARRTINDFTIHSAMLCLLTRDEVGDSNLRSPQRIRMSLSE